MSIKAESTEVMSWENAIRSIPAKGYRQTKNGRYEAFVSDHSKSIFLGTYDTIEEAKNAVYTYRTDRFISGVAEHGLNPDNGVVYENNYVAFKNGMIFNLHGKQMVGGVNKKSGYRHGIFNGRNRDHHKVLADCFIPNPHNLRDVNHKNGNKLDLHISNLERTTHADNVLHAYRTGLERKRYGEEVPTHKLTKNYAEYIRTMYKRYDRNFGSGALARKFGVDKSTILDVVKGETWRCEE